MRIENGSVYLIRLINQNTLPFPFLNELSSTMSLSQMVTTVSLRADVVQYTVLAVQRPSDRFRKVNFSNVALRRNKQQRLRQTATASSLYCGCRRNITLVIRSRDARTA